MTRLLVSVRDVAEAEVALEGGTALLDVKEPRHGSLGPATPEVIAQIVAVTAGRAPVSAALGELAGEHVPADSIPAGLAYGKLGLAGCRGRADWRTAAATAISRWPRSMAAVGVVYADHKRADAPTPEEVLAWALSAGCRALLVDTWCKRSGGLLDHLSIADLARLVTAAQAAGLAAVVAGSLDEGSIARVLPLAPDYVAVRSAVCAGDRTGRIDAAKVRSVHAVLSGGGEAPPRRSARSVARRSERV